MKKIITIVVGIIVILFVALLGVGCLAGDDTSSTTEEVSTEAIEYTPYDIAKMESDLEDNAMVAEDTYNDAYVEVEGVLDNIDSDGSYFTITNPADEWDIIGIQCFFTDDSQKDVIKTKKTGDTIKVRGQITEVGEIMGYSLDVSEIE